MTGMLRQDDSYVQIIHRVVRTRRGGVCIHLCHHVKPTLEMLAIYVDESCADGRNRYLVHGALFLRGAMIEPLRQRIAGTVEASRIQDEIKWSGINRAKRAREEAVVAHYFDGVSIDQPASGYRFQSLVVDQHRLDVAGYHEGDRDRCFYKCLYQLLVKRIATFSQAGEDVHIVLDQRNTLRYDLQDLRGSLNNALVRDLQERAPIVRTATFRDSRTCRLLQLSDLLTGAVGFHQNGRHLRSDSSEHKVAVSSLIADRARMTSLAVPNSGRPQMGIWTLRMGTRR